MEVNLNENSNPNALMDETIFEKIQEAYWKVKKESTDPHDVELRSSMDPGSAINRALVPFEIRMGPYGRGLFTTKKVPRGARVWGCDWYGIFKTKEEWLAFLSALPQKYHKDMFAWSYVMEWEHELGTHVVGLDLDEASLMNHAGGLLNHDGVQYDQANESVVRPDNNLGYDLKHEYLVAVRDIAASEELLCDYSSFHVYDHPLTWWENGDVPQQSKS